MKTCSEHTGGHSELKGVIVAQGSWQKEEKKTLSGKKWWHVIYKKNKSFLDVRLASGGTGNFCSQIL